MKPDSTPADFDTDALTEWLRDAIAIRLDRDPDEVGAEVPFGDFGLDSVSIMDVLGDLEDLLGRRFDTSLLFDYPTIESLATHLNAEL